MISVYRSDPINEPRRLGEEPYDRMTEDEIIWHERVEKRLALMGYDTQQLTISIMRFWFRQGITIHEAAGIAMILMEARPDEKEV